MVTQNKINKIVKTIANNYSPEKIILFGSYAYGKPTEDSDLDLLVVVKKNSQPRYKRAREIRRYLWGITDVPKDILVYTQNEIDEWKEVKEAFITMVIKKGKVLYENKEGTNRKFFKSKGVIFCLKRYIQQYLKKSIIFILDI